MPVVEGGELVHQVDHSRDLILGVVAHNLLSGELSGDVVAFSLALDEALEVGLESAIGNGGVVGAPGTVQFKVDTSNGVVRVVDNRVKVLELTAHLLTLRVSNVQRVAERSVVDNVVKTLLVDTTEDIVETTVLHQNPDNILNLVLQVGNGLLGTGGVAEGTVGVAVDDGADGAAGETQKGKKSVGLHDSTAEFDLEARKELWLVNEREKIISEHAMVVAFYMSVFIMLVQLVERGSSSIP